MFYMGTGLTGAYPAPASSSIVSGFGGRAIIDGGVLQQHLESETLPPARAHQPTCYDSTERCWTTPRQYSPTFLLTSPGATSRVVRWSSVLTDRPALGLDVNAKQHDSCSYGQD